MTATPFSIAYDAALDAAIIGVRNGKNVDEVVRIATDRFKRDFPAASAGAVADLEKDIRDAHGETAAEHIGGTGEYAKRFSSSQAAKIYSDHIQKLLSDRVPQSATPSAVNSMVTTIPPGFVTRIKGNAARALVISYALFIVGSLFCAPWSVPSYLSYTPFGDARISTVKWAPIFYPPEIPRRTPHLMFEQMLLVWGALGILTASVVWASRKRN